MNLRQVRNKIKSVKNVKKITKAMQLVSAVKMKKAQQVAVEGRPYHETLQHIINKIVPTVDVTFSPLLTESTGAKRELMILVSSNKGLAGAFNVNLFRVLLKIERIKEIDFIALGKKGALFANTFGKSVIADFSSGNPSTEVSAVFELVVQKFLAGEYSNVSILYNKFVSTLKSEAVKETILPIKLETETEAETGESTTEYLVEPTRQELLEFLLKSYIESRIRNAVLNSEAAEHSARMIAMKNATDNANDLIINFTSLGNKLRQSKITNELLDMITAKESIETIE